MSFPGKLAPFLPLGGIPPRFPLVKAANITLLRLCHTWAENARRPIRGAALFLRESVFSVGRDPCVPPKNAYPAAGHTGPALQDGMLNRAKRDIVPQGHLFRCAPLQDAVPYGVHGRDGERWGKMFTLAALTLGNYYCIMN